MHARPNMPHRPEVHWDGGKQEGGETGGGDRILLSTFGAISERHIRPGFVDRLKSVEMQRCAECRSVSTIHAAYKPVLQPWSLPE